MLQHLAPLEVIGKLAVPCGDMAALDGGHRPAPQGAALEQGEVRTAQQLAGVHGAGGPQVTSTRSASLPGRMVPFRGYTPKILAGFMVIRGTSFSMGSSWR